MVFSTKRGKNVVTLREKSTKMAHAARKKVDNGGRNLKPTLKDKYTTKVRHKKTDLM